MFAREYYESLRSFFLGCRKQTLPQKYAVFVKSSITVLRQRIIGAIADIGEASPDILFARTRYDYHILFLPEFCQKFLVFCYNRRLTSRKRIIEIKKDVSRHC